MKPPEPPLERARQRLVGLCLLLVLLSVSWVVLGTFDPFHVYDRLLAHALFGARSLGPLAAPVFRFTMGLHGAASAALFGLLAAVVQYAFPARWAYRAAWYALGGWAGLGAVASIMAGAYFSLLLLHGPGFAALGVGLWMGRACVAPAPSTDQKP